MPFAFGREQERGLRIPELERDALHLAIGETTRIQHDAGWIAGESILRERVYLVDGHGTVTRE
jgi:hypothetical protein